MQLECQDWEAEVVDIFGKSSETPDNVCVLEFTTAYSGCLVGIVSFCTCMPLKYKVKPGIFMFEKWLSCHFHIAGKLRTFCENGKGISFYRIKRSYSQIH